MSGYVPTTEQLREAYASDPESEYHDPVGYPAWQRELRASFDRWLAAHDAEVRASVVSEEPEWEYGIVAEAFGGEPDPHPSYEAAAHVRDNTKTLYRKWTHGSEVAIFRRRKAGPWMPVAAESTNHEKEQP